MTEINLQEHQQIDIARALAGPLSVTRYGRKVLGRVLLGPLATDTDAIGYGINENGSVECSHGYTAVVSNGTIIGFRK